jgi:glycogen operon protein
VPEFASRLTGSSDLYESDSRHPVASINFVTAHDGFTLADLVSYNVKHNIANGEGNRDGESHNRSWNCGIEGPSDDQDVIELRSRQQRNLLATLMLSQGVPMLLGGDEIGRSQGGNNNGYCQDNEVSWFNWDKPDTDLLAFTRELIALRRRHPVLRRRRWFQGRPIRGTADIGWFGPDGTEMDDDDWDSGVAQAIAVVLNGDAITGRNSRGQRVIDDSFLIIFNGSDEDIKWSIPEPVHGAWELVFDTARPSKDKTLVPKATVGAMARSVVVFTSENETAN